MNFYVELNLSTINSTQLYSLNNNNTLSAVDFSPLPRVPLTNIIYPFHGGRRTSSKYVLSTPGPLRIMFPQATILSMVSSVLSMKVILSTFS